MNFGEILSKAWKITWKYKILWVFGILSSCSGSVGNIRSFLNTDSNRYKIPQIESFMENLAGVTLALFFVGFFLFVIISIYLTLTGMIGIITGASKADEMDQDAQPLQFKALFRSSQSYLWRVLKTNFVTGSLMVISAILLVIPLFLMTDSSAMLCLVPLICLIIPVYWVLGTIAQQAIVALINEDLGTMDSIRRAWQIVIKENLGSYILLSLILGIGSVILGLLISLPTFLVIIPIAFGSTTGNGLTAGIVFLALYLLIIATPLTGILNTYIQTAWTLVFRRCASASPWLEETEMVEVESELPNVETTEAVE